MHGIMGQPPVDMMSSSLNSMAAQSRHALRSNSNAEHKESDSQPSTNEYELQRDRKKKALHDRVELALIESGFGEAAKLRCKFSGERTFETPTPKCSRPHRRRARVGTTLLHERRRSARNLGKTGAVVLPPSPTEGGVKKVCNIRRLAMCMHVVLKE